MADETTRFFETLATSGHQPLLAHASGSIRFDIGNGDEAEHWVVSVDHGDIGVVQKDAPADSVVRVDRALFSNIATGKQNATAAVLRGTMAVTGSPSLLMSFQRLLPGPPRTERKLTTTAEERTRP